MKKLSVVIPVYNEKETIREILKKVSGVSLPNNILKEIILVDDGSTDGTRELLSEFSNSFRIVFLKKNQGKGTALKEGFRIATGEYILIQDADLEYNPEDYLKLIEPVIKNGAEVVFGSRVLGNNNVSFSKIYFYGGLFLTKIFNFLFSSHLTDMATCYKLFPVRFVHHLIKLPSNDFVFDVVELTCFFTRYSKVLEVPINYHSRSRKKGKKLNWRDGVRCFMKIIQLRFQK